jgi:glutamine cyclotransferase
MRNHYISSILNFIIIGLLCSCSNDKTQEKTSEEALATFSLEPSVSIKLGESKEIPIVIKNDNIKALKLTIDDSTVTSWSNPKNKVSYTLSSKKLGVGAHTLYLNISLKDGDQYTETMQLVVLSDQVPAKWKPTIKAVLPHNTSSFTQGLEFSNGALYESTGNFGQSIIAKVDLSTGNHLQKVALENQYFGEGITLLNGEVYQITWQQNKCFVYKQADLTLVKEYSYNGEGWGLCNNGKQIIMSDGTEKLVFRNPSTFVIERTIQVYNNIGPVTQLNELEYQDGKIYANVWRTNTIVVIDEITGKVLAEIDANEIEKAGKGGGDVLNGIAFNSDKNLWYLAGKNWPKLFEVTFETLP